MSTSADVNPRRVISIEETVKGGLCRSCGQTLNIGELRIRVAYPNVIVQYAARAGSPSFFMHPTCFESQPVDFWRIGPTAYKETVSVQNFALNPEVDVMGWNKYPGAHQYFDTSRAMSLKQRELPKDEESPGKLLRKTDGLPCREVVELGTESDPQTNNNQEELSDCQDAIKSIKLQSTPDNVDLLHGRPLSQICPRKRRAEFVKCTIAPTPKPTYDADQEEERLKYKQLLKRHEYDMLSTELTEKEAAEVARDMMTKEFEITGEVRLKEPTSRSARCDYCSCHSLVAEREWASPKDAAEMLGVTTAILRSLAQCRAIPIFVRPSGQRVYNLPGIRKYIEENTLRAMPTATKKHRNDD